MILKLDSTENPTAKDIPVMTGEELYAEGDSNSGELIKGEFIGMAPPGFWHGIQENRFGNIQDIERRLQRVDEIQRNLQPQH